jgi:hypothetical protein
MMKLTLVTNELSIFISLKMAEQSEAKNAERSFASKYMTFRFSTRSFASRFLRRFAQQFLARLKRTTIWSFYFHGLKMFFQDSRWERTQDTDGEASHFEHGRIKQLQGSFKTHLLFS